MIDCIFCKLNLKLTIKNINIKIENIITKYYQKLVLQNIFFIIFILFLLKLIEINLLQILIFNANISFFTTN